MPDLTFWDETGSARAPRASSLLSALVAASDDAIIYEDLDGIILGWNGGAQRIFGFTAAEILGTSILRLFPSEEPIDMPQSSVGGHRDPSLKRLATLAETKHRGQIAVLVTESSVVELDGQRVGVSKVVRDVAPLKEREREIARLSRLYLALGQVNQAIVTTQERSALFQKICQVLVEQGGFRTTWIGWQSPDGRHIQPVARWGDEHVQIQSVQLDSDAQAHAQGPSGIAFRKGRPYVCNDLLNDPATLEWRSQIEHFDFRSAAAFPIREAGTVAGVLSVYATEAGVFEDREMALLTGAAADISFALDNIERKEARELAEQTLRHERDFSDAVLNSLPGILYLYDRTGRFLRWNQNFQRESGYSDAEIAAMNPLQFFSDADKPLVSKRINDVFDHGQADVEAGFVSKTGQVTPYFFTGILAQIDSRACLVGVGIDIAQRKRLEEARAASEGRYRTLFEHAPDGILIADGQSHYIDANTAICGMLGYTRQELIGLHASDIVEREELPQIATALSAINARSDYHREWRFRRKDGSVLAAEVTATLMPDGNLLGVVRDISERKRAEKALRELNETLELKVAARTSELSSALVRAEAADRLKSAFLATMSHELRTPLNSILGFTGIVIQGMAGPLTGEQAKQLGMVQNSARHLLDLINDVLDLSKIEADQLEVRAAPFDLAASLEKTVASVRASAERKNLALTLSMHGNLGEMISDRRRVEQIILNLLNNAIKFTDAGSVTVTADLLETSSPNAQAESERAVKIRVSDTGIGLKAADLSSLFKPFRQIDSGLTRQHEGTGLGLAICRKLTSLLGGEIAVTSVWAKGSEFALTLPMRRDCNR